MFLKSEKAELITLENVKMGWKNSISSQIQSKKKNVAKIIWHSINLAERIQIPAKFSQKNILFLKSEKAELITLENVKMGWKNSISSQIQSKKKNVAKIIWHSINLAERIQIPAKFSQKNILLLKSEKAELLWKM